MWTMIVLRGKASIDANVNNFRKLFNFFVFFLFFNFSFFSYSFLSHFFSCFPSPATSEGWDALTCPHLGEPSVEAARAALAHGQ